MARKKIRIHTRKKEESSNRGSKTFESSGRSSYIFDPGEDIIAQYRDQPIDVAYAAFAKFHEERRAESQTPDNEKKAEDEHSPQNVPPEFKAKLKATENEGQEFTPKDRKYFEERFGTDFSGVKIHTGPTAEELAKMVNARAFTVKNHIYFGKGEFSPGSTEGKKLIAHELAHTIQQEKTGQEKIQRWVLPTDWLDMIGLSIDLAERIYIELAYEEGQEKDFQLFVNSIFFALDAVMMALPGVGGGGLAFRGSHQLAVAGWHALPSSAKSTVTKEVAKAMGWGMNRTAQMINRYFAANHNNDGKQEKPSGDRRNVDSHEQSGGHTHDRHVGKSENWLKNRLKNDPNIDAASTFTSEAAANRVQGQFVKRYKKEIEAWLKSGDRPFIRKVTMNNIIGFVLERGKSKSVPTKKALAMIVRDVTTPQGWHFVTSYPVK